MVVDDEKGRTDEVHLLNSWSSRALVLVGQKGLGEKPDGGCTHHRDLLP